MYALSQLHPCAVCYVCVQLIRVIKLSGQSEADRKARVIQSARDRQPGEDSASHPANGDAEGVQEASSSYTVIDTIYDDFCEGCRSQERAERYVGYSHHCDSMADANAVLPTVSAKLLSVCTLTADARV